MKCLLVGLSLLGFESFLQDGPQEPSPLGERIRVSLSLFDRAHRDFEMSLLELGPAALPELERQSGPLQGARREAVGAVIDRIKSLRGQIEKLVAELGHELVETRERASAELRKIGRPAHSYLEAALGHADAEVRNRAKTLLVLISHQEREKIRWSSLAEAYAKRVATLEVQLARGSCTREDLLIAKRAWMKARCKAGQVSRQDYLKAARESLALRLELLEKGNKVGTVETSTLLGVRLELLYVDRRRGVATDEAIQDLQLLMAELLQSKRQQGRLNELDYLKQLAELLSDADEDLDR